MIIALVILALLAFVLNIWDARNFPLDHMRGAPMSKPTPPPKPPSKEVPYGTKYERPH